MANIKSQKKRALTNAKKNLINTAERSRLKTAIKKVQKAVEAKMFIEEGEVKVNGEVDTRRGRKIKPGDVVEFQGESVSVIN